MPIRYKYYVFLSVLLMICLAPLLKTDKYSDISWENRKLAVFPQFPGYIVEAENLRGFTRGIENWLNDRIGFRRRMMKLYGWIHINALKTSPHKQVLLGRNGHAYLASHGNANASYNSFVKQTLYLPQITPDLIQRETRNLIEIKKLTDSYNVPSVGC